MRSRCGGNIFRGGPTLFLLNQCVDYLFRAPDREGTGKGGGCGSLDTHSKLSPSVVVIVAANNARLGVTQKSDGASGEIFKFADVCIWFGVLFGSFGRNSLCGARE